MTQENSKICPEFFFHDACIPNDIRAILRGGDRALDAATGVLRGTGTGVERIAAERRRQVEQEGWSAAHDDKHNDQASPVTDEGRLSSVSRQTFHCEDAADAHGFVPRRIESGPSAGGYSLEPPLTFGQVVRRERERRKLTVEELAERMDSDDNEGPMWFLEAVESAEGLGGIDLSDVVAFARAFGLTPQQLLADVGVWE